MKPNPLSARRFAFAAALAGHITPGGEDRATNAMEARFDTLNDDSVTGSESLADSLIETGPGFHSLSGMGGDAIGGGMIRSRRSSHSDCPGAADGCTPRWFISATRTGTA